MKELTLTKLDPDSDKLIFILKIGIMHEGTTKSPWKIKIKL